MGNIESLKQDMTADYMKSADSPKEKYVYVLCPDTVFDLSGMTASNTTTILLSNTEIRCGIDGSSSNNCLFYGGEHHMVFHPDVIVSDVLIEGIKFTRSKSTSIIAWGKPQSTATFRDCHWEENFGFTLIDIYPSDKQRRRRRRRLLPSSSQSDSLYEMMYSPSHYFNQLLQDKSNNKNALLMEKIKNYDDLLLTNSDRVSITSTTNAAANEESNNDRKLQGNNDVSKDGGAMVIRLYDSLLSSNELSTGLILNVAGVVDITKSSFALNTNQAVGVGVSDTGTLILDTDSDFVKNTNGFSTIFLDPTSKLRIINKHANSNDNKIGLATSENEGLRCNGIFVENYDSECLSTGGFVDGVCYGICCDFALKCFNA